MLQSAPKRHIGLEYTSRSGQTSVRFKLGASQYHVQGAWKNFSARNKDFKRLYVHWKDQLMIISPERRKGSSSNPGSSSAGKEIKGYSSREKTTAPSQASQKKHISGSTKEWCSVTCALLFSPTGKASKLPPHVSHLLFIFITKSAAPVLQSAMWLPKHWYVAT